MLRFSSLFPAAMILALACVARADITNNFSTNPLGTAIVQGPDAANVNSRFTYNSAAGTLTAHYDSTEPTIKLLFPLGRNFTQNDSFKMTTTFAIQSSGFDSPVDFGAEVPSFGLVNSATTGNLRASTGHTDPSTFAFTEITPGTAYDDFSVDYFPTQDNTFGGNSINLTTIQSAQAGSSFDGSFKFGFADTTLPFDQFISAVVTYDASTHQAKLDWGTGSLTSDLTGAVFNVDSFAITLWSDPNLAPTDGGDPAGSPVGANVVFDSFSVVAAPEPGTLAMLGGAVCWMLGRRAAKVRRH